jgi:tetratricopeptide (TPR) repeat protein
MKVLAKVLAPLFLCPVLASLGCRSMTSAKEAEILDDKLRLVQAATEIAKAHNEEAERRAEEERRFNAKIEKRAIAAQRLASGDAAGALELVETLLAPVAVTRKDEASGQEEQVLEKPALDPSEEAEILALKGAALAELGNFDQALPALEGALDLDPDHRPARRSLGKVLFAQRKYRPALEAWQPVLEDGARDADLLSLVAQARYEVARAEKSPSAMEGARLAMLALLLARPGDSELLRQLTVLEFETGRYADAIQHAEVILAETPLDPDYLELVANAWIHLGDRAKALDRLDLAAGLRAPSKNTARTLSDLCRSQGFPAEAAEWLVRAHRGDPRVAPPDERFLAGSLLADAGRKEEAVTWLSALADGEPHFAAAQSRLVPLLAKLGKADAALAAYEKVHTTQPQDGASHLAAAQLFLERRQLEAAAAAYSRASGLPDTRARALAGLAEVAYAKHDLASALDYYRLALDLRPGDPRFSRAVEQIRADADLQEAESLFAERSRQADTQP